jgi:hypothetical protein
MASLAERLEANRAARRAEVAAGDRTGPILSESVPPVSRSSQPRSTGTSGGARAKKPSAARNWAKAGVAAQLAGKLQVSKLERMRQERLRKAAASKQVTSSSDADTATSAPRLPTVYSVGHDDDSSDAPPTVDGARAFSDRLYPVRVGGRRAQRTGSAESAEGVDASAEMSERLYPVKADGRRARRKSTSSSPQRSNSSKSSNSNSDGDNNEQQLSLAARGKLQSGDYTPRTAVRVSKRNLEIFKTQSAQSSPPPSPTSSEGQCNPLAPSMQAVVVEASPTLDTDQMVLQVQQLQQEREDLFQAAVSEIYELESKLRAYEEAVGSIEAARVLALRAGSQDQEPPPPPPHLPHQQQVSTQSRGSESAAMPPGATSSSDRAHSPVEEDAVSANHPAAQECRAVATPSSSEGTVAASMLALSCSDSSTDDDSGSSTDDDDGDDGDGYYISAAVAEPEAWKRTAL